MDWDQGQGGMQGIFDEEHLMLILVHANGFELDWSLRERVVGKMELALARFSARISKVSCYMTDANGPKGGLDKSIRLVVAIDRQPRIIIEEKGEDWFAMLDSVADRVSHNVSRQIERNRLRFVRPRLLEDRDPHVI